MQNCQFIIRHHVSKPPKAYCFTAISILQELTIIKIGTIIQFNEILSDIIHTIFELIQYIMEENGTKFINLENTVTNCDHFKSIILLNHIRRLFK